MSRPARHVAAVTGSTRGIGRATVLALADAGADVVVLGRSDLSAAQDVAEQARRRGVRATARLVDVGDRRSVVSLQAALAADGFAVDVLVNNAAVRPHQPFLAITEEDWRAVVDVVLTGAFRCSQAFLPHMVDRGWGRIVNVIGVRGQSGGPERGHLVAAKSGLVGLTKALAHEFGPHGVTANAVSPGTIATEKDAADPARLEARKGIGVLGRFGAPQDVADAIAFLAGESAGYITGQLIGVNGGEHM